MSKKKKSKKGGARPGSGPKPKMANGRAVAIRLGDEHFAVLDSYAKQKGTTRPEALRQIVLAHFKGI